jgi:nucleoid-associated protein YgaU
MWFATRTVARICNLLTRRFAIGPQIAALYGIQGISHFREGLMGIFDKKDSPIFGDKPGSDAPGKAGANPDFSDTTSSAGSTSPSRPTADFSDVTSGQSTTAPTSGGQTYTVKSGDSLSRIAKQLYGDASKWHRIYDANKDKIKNPDLIHPGQEFTIPDA